MTRAERVSYWRRALESRPADEMARDQLRAALAAERREDAERSDAAEMRRLRAGEVAR